MSAMIAEKLAALDCAAWELCETDETRWEFYFIGHRLDQNRSVKLRQTEVKVYVATQGGEGCAGSEGGEGGEGGAAGAFLGSATDVISPTATEAEIDATLEKLKFQASLMKNPPYALADEPVAVPAQTEPVDVSGIAEACIRAFDSVPETAVQRLNSYEIFVSAITRHTLNSNGVEYTCTYPNTMLDVVVNAKREGHEVEIYRIYHSGTCDGERLTADLVRLMGFAEDRLSAGSTPHLGQGDVLLSTEDAVSVYQYFASQTMADYVVRRMSAAELGKPFVKDGAGDAVTLRIVPQLPNSSKNMPVDKEGNPVFARYLIRDGVVENFWGSRQFSQYLGLAKSSAATNLVVEGGASSEAELRAGNYLEVVEFSNFNVDDMSGDIAGEIRLGYWHHDGVTDIVTGGSVSGSLAEAARTMQFSRETVQYDNWQIPRVTLLKGLRITGIGE